MIYEQCIKLIFEIHQIYQNQPPLLTRKEIKGKARETQTNKRRKESTE